MGVCEVQDCERKFAFVLYEMSTFKVERKTGNATDHEMKISHISGLNYTLDAVQSGDCAAVLGHRITENIYLEETSKIIKVQPLTQH